MFTATACGLLLSFVPLRQSLVGLGAGLSALALFLRPEIALALFLVAGTVKADPRISSVVAVDLTVVLATLLALSCVFKFFTGRTVRPALPPTYPLYLFLILMMLASLFYTPNLTAGIDKCARFVFLTGLAIVSPFFLFDTPQKVKAFLYALAAAGFLLSLDALTRLGGTERLTTLGGLTIQLGSAAGISLAVIWMLLLPQFTFRKRIFLLPLMAVPLVALIGSGARGAALGAACVILFGVVVHRFLIVDTLVLAGVGTAGLTLVAIPQASYDYLSTLLSARSTAVLGFRNDLMSLAWRLIQEHPLLGVGIGGYPYYSPDPQDYGWPHNIFLELGSELGVVAAAIFVALVAWCFWEAFKEFRSPTFPLRNIAAVVFSLLIFGFLQMIKSGDINDNRGMWLYLGLPFLLRLLDVNCQAETKPS